MLWKSPLIALMCCFAGAATAQPSTQLSTSHASTYATNAAALASAMTYCEARHGVITTGSASARCFSAARGLLPAFNLNKRSQDIARQCNDLAVFNTCVTPEIAKLVRALNAEFRTSNL